MHNAVPIGLLKILAGFIFAVVGSSAKTAKVCTVQKFPTIRYMKSLVLDMIMLFSQFVVFAEREEGNTPYHRQYDFFIQRFASLSLVADSGDEQKYKE